LQQTITFGVKYVIQLLCCNTGIQLFCVVFSLWFCFTIPRTVTSHAKTSHCQRRTPLCLVDH